jgi:hypothetical protein
MEENVSKAKTPTSVGVTAPATPRPLKIKVEQKAFLAADDLMEDLIKATRNAAADGAAQVIWDREHDDLLLHWARGGEVVTVHVHVRTELQTRMQMKLRGLGGELQPGCDRLVNGWELAEALCALLTGMHPGRSKHGRGSKHQACIDALRATGENGPRKTGVV